VYILGVNKIQGSQERKREAATTATIIKLITLCIYYTNANTIERCEQCPYEDDVHLKKVAPENGN